MFLTSQSGILVPVFIRVCFRISSSRVSDGKQHVPKKLHVYFNKKYISITHSSSGEKSVTLSLTSSGSSPLEVRFKGEATPEWHVLNF